MEKNSNKKVVNAVKKFVVGASAKAKMLEKKNAKILKKVGKKWDSTKPERVKMGIAVKRAVKLAEKKTDRVIKKTTQMADDIATGFKEGIKEVKSKSKK
jgi:hypothetical protein